MTRLVWVARGKPYEKGRGLMRGGEMGTSWRAEGLCVGEKGGLSGKVPRWEWKER